MSNDGHSGVGDMWARAAGAAAGGGGPGGVTTGTRTNSRGRRGSGSAAVSWVAPSTSTTITGHKGLVTGESTSAVHGVGGRLPIIPKRSGDS